MQSLMSDKPSLKLLKVKTNLKQTIHTRVTYQTPTPYLRGQQTGTIYIYLVSSLCIFAAINSLPVPPTVFLVFHFTTLPVTWTADLL
jgi:hypothetical protein